MAPVLRPNLLSVMAQATSPSPRLWPPETCSEHTALTVGTSGSGGVGGSGSSADEVASFATDKERAPWPVTLGTLLALQLGWGLWLMPAVYAR